MRQRRSEWKAERRIAACACSCAEQDAVHLNKSATKVTISRHLPVLPGYALAGMRSRWAVLAVTATITLGSGTLPPGCYSNSTQNALDLVEMCCQRRSCSKSWQSYRGPVRRSAESR